LQGHRELDSERINKKGEKKKEKSEGNMGGQAKPPRDRPRKKQS